MAKKSPPKKSRASIDKSPTLTIMPMPTASYISVADLPTHASDLDHTMALSQSAPTLSGKPKTLAEYMADKGRALREHVGLPPMPKLIPCQAPPAEDVSTLAMCFCTPREIKDIGSDDWIASSRAISKALLKRKMLERALSGDSQMMTWLSKQHLGYREPKSDEQAQTTINVLSSSMPTVLNDKVIEVKQ